MVTHGGAVCKHEDVSEKYDSDAKIVEEYVRVHYTL